jgi:hypothetical protein
MRNESFSWFFDIVNRYEFCPLLRTPPCLIKEADRVKTNNIEIELILVIFITSNLLIV